MRCASARAAELAPPSGDGCALGEGTVGCAGAGRMPNKPGAMLGVLNAPAGAAGGAEGAEGAADGGARMLGGGGRRALDGGIGVSNALGRGGGSGGL
jgi:hypothetical protein